MNPKFRIIGCILIGFLIFGVLSAAEQPEVEPQEEQQDTTITFRIQQQDEQDEDYIEVEVTIVTKDPHSLVSALSQSQKKVQAVNNAVTRYCQNDDQQKDCDQAVEVEQQVEPKYHEVKKQQVFQGFQVTNTLKITIHNPEGIGKLMDEVLKCGISKIESFTWKAENEKDNDRLAIKEGISQAKSLCKAINMKFKQIISIEQIEQEEEQAQEGEDPETPPIVFEIVASCEEDENASAGQQDDEDEDDEGEGEGDNQDEQENEDEQQQVVPEPPKPKPKKQTQPKQKPAKEAQPKPKTEKKVEKPKATTQKAAEKPAAKAAEKPAAKAAEKPAAKAAEKASQPKKNPEAKPKVKSA